MPVTDVQWEVSAVGGAKEMKCKRRLSTNRDCKFVTQCITEIDDFERFSSCLLGGVAGFMILRLKVSRLVLKTCT